VQPFGGSKLSGTGPKAGGPLYLGRLVESPPPNALTGARKAAKPDAAARAFVTWLRRGAHKAEAEVCAGYLVPSVLGVEAVLPGPVGERNVYSLRPRGRVVAHSTTSAGLLGQLGAILATGNVAVVNASHPAHAILGALPREVAARILTVEDWRRTPRLRAVLLDGGEDALRNLLRELSEAAGPILPVMASRGAEAGRPAYDLERLLEERSVSTNTAAVGGDPGLMSLG
jgi:RHH-type proline utilization regulon transcriptional repressor/proline dehydrogenase/delta 1-pyrroline-5-carboxylate dehydrogenase